MNQNHDENKVVRDDDLAFGLPGVTRYAIRWVILTLAAITVAAIAFFGYTIVHQNRTEKQDIHKIACTIVAPYPDSTVYVKHVRADYNCPPYDPNVLRKPPPYDQKGGK
jgi:hypothetical protein